MLLIFIYSYRAYILWNSSCIDTTLIANLKFIHQRKYKWFYLWLITCPQSPYIWIKGFKKQWKVSLGKSQSWLIQIGISMIGRKTKLTDRIKGGRSKIRKDSVGADLRLKKIQTDNILINFKGPIDWSINQQSICIPSVGIDLNIY